MKKISNKEAEHIAKLANLDLTKKELEKFTSQLSSVIDFNFSHLKNINTDGVEPTTHTLEITNRMRDDETEPGINAKEALQNAKEVHNDFLKVDAVLDTGEEAKGKK